MIVASISLAILLALDSSGNAEKGRSDGTAYAWGVYEDIWNPAHYPAKLDACIRSLGSAPKYVLVFRDLVRPFPVSIIASRPDITFIISLELCEWEHPREKYLDRIVSGEYDSFFRKWAHDAASAKSVFLLRFGFEMSGKWFSWGGQPDLFRKAWAHVHGIFRNEGATNARWVFSPNVLFGTMSAEQDIQPYYPGDSLVDWVALDGYNFGDNHDAYHRWSSYSEIFEKSIRIMSRFPKPLLLAEVGCADDRRKPEWMKDFLSAVSRDRRVRGFVYFNYDKRSENEPNWALDSDSVTYSIFKTWIRANRK